MLLKLLKPSIILAIFLGSLFALYSELSEINPSDVYKNYKDFPVWIFLLSVLCSFAGYLTLVFYDLTSLSYAGVKLGFFRTAITSFISFALCNVLGFPLLTGTATRYHFYSSWGVETKKIAKAIAFNSTIIWLGFTILAGILLTLGYGHILFKNFDSINIYISNILGVFLISVPAVIYICSKLSLSLSLPFVSSNKFKFPQPKFIIQGTFVSALDWLLAGISCYILIAYYADISFLEFLTIILLAQVCGLLSHIPGGIGVFELIMIKGLSASINVDVLLGVLILYRISYNLIPFVLALIVLTTYEANRSKEQLDKARKAIKTTVTSFGSYLPPVLAGACLIAGTLLVLDGQLPPSDSNFASLPLFLLEFSHFGASVFGTVLILLSRGLLRRVNLAYLTSVTMLAGAFVLSLVGHFHPETSIFLLILLIIIIPSKNLFYRKAALLTDPFSSRFTLVISIIFCTAFWILLFSYKQIPYGHQLWWEFTFEGNASRSLRALITTLVIFSAWTLHRIFVPGRGSISDCDQNDYSIASTLLNSTSETRSNLLYLNDKLIFLSPSNDSLLLYANSGKTAVVLGDPFGNPETAVELIWDFYEKCEQKDYLCCFYEVSNHYLEAFSEIGLRAYKIGELARIDLVNFSMAGKKRLSLRNVRSRISREGYTYRVIESKDIKQYLPRMREISDAWLKEKSGKEKKFSLGYFDEEYLSRFNHAMVFKGDELIAFTNLWENDSLEEISVDLMRYLPKQTSNLMDFLFVELFLWAQAKGYKSFNFGMAPFSGLEDETSYKWWAKIGHFIFTHGEVLYNFQGLRAYKNKFNPEWENRYLIIPNEIHLPRVIKDLAKLVSGGISSAIVK